MSNSAKIFFVFAGLVALSPCGFSASRDLPSGTLLEVAGDSASSSPATGTPAPAPLADIASLVPVASSSETLAGEISWRSSAAQALAADIPSLAAELARASLADADLSNASRDRLLLTLSGAQISMGDYSGARETLARITGTSPRKTLREIYVSIFENRVPEIEIPLAEIDPEKLPAGEKSWYFLARAILFAFRGKPTEAESNFVRAENFATGATARDHIDFVRRWAETIGGNALTQQQLQALKDARDTARGKPGFEAAGKLYVVALAKNGDRAGALAALRETVPVPEKDAADFALLEGLLIDDSGSVPARAAFERVISARPPRSRQAAAFAGLLRGVRSLNTAQKTEEAIVAANGIEKFLASLLPDDRVRDIELFTRARIAFEVGNLRRADVLASELAARFPASPFVADSLRLRVGIARQEKEFRRAIPLLEKLRLSEETDSGRAFIDILIADCHFLSGDYALAADAYARATGTTAFADKNELGAIFFQQALSNIRCGNVAKASALLDSPLADGVPAEWTMRTECVVIEALQKAGLFAEAVSRAEEFLRRPDLLPDFRVRILWIRALLALDMGDAGTVLRAAGEIELCVARFDDEATVSPALRATAEELLSRVVLLKALAQFLSDSSSDEALQLLADLRERYPDSAAAAISWLEEGRRFTRMGKPERAIVSYENLLDRYGSREKFAEYAAIACFESAQAAATAGRPREAVKQMQTLISRYPKSPLAFFARMRQADFFRILNDFDSALAVYDNLLATTPERPEKRIVEMRRADTLQAMATRTDSGGNATAAATDAQAKAESAYERLFSLPDQPLALKAEAGFKWGYAVAAAVPADSANAEKARTIYWKTVTQTFDEAQSRGNASVAEAGLGSGAYWLSRSLFALAESYEKTGDYVSARAVYQKIIDWSAAGVLQGKTYAERRLQRILEK